MDGIAIARESRMSSSSGNSVNRRKTDRRHKRRACYSIHVDKYSKYSLHPSTFVYVYYVSEATRMTGYGPD